MQNQKFKDLVKQELKNKTRSIKDLARFVQRNNGYPSYSVFLGAGASVTSGIPTGGSLVKQWREEIYKEVFDSNIESLKDNELEIINYLSKNEGIWYNPQNEYSSLFERKFDLPSQRRRFVESIVDNKKPSIGYNYLINLVNEKAFNTIFTTNFDDLLNEAFYHFSDVRPHVCAHDSSIGSLSVLSDRPKIIKLHGDYLFDDIKNTLKETESLENNTREKFIEFSKDYGLIIVGYSGQDRSIMDVLNYLVQQEEYLKNGVYWCFREDDEISHEVRKILWKDKVYCVKIDGFDQLFAELNNELGINLKQFSEKNSLKIDKCIENFIKDDFNLSSNDYIRKDLLKLKEKSNNQDISELIAKLNESNQNNNLSSIEFKQILEIQNLILTGSFNKTVAKIDKLLQDSGCDLSSELTKFQENLFFMKIDCLEKEKKIEQANEAINSLIASDKFNLTYHHKKILLINDSKKNIEYLLSILDLFPYSASIRNDICRSYLSYYLKSKVEPDLINVDKCLNYIEESLNIDNSLDNLAYEIKVELLFIKKDLISKKTSSTLNRNKIIDETNDQIKELIVKVLTVNPKHQNSIDCLINYLIKSDSSVDFLKFYNQIFLNIDKSSKKQKRYIIKSFAMLFNKRKMLERYQKDSDIKKEAVNFFSKPEFDSNIFYLLYKTMFMISLNVRDISFYNLIEKCINHKNVYEIALELVSLLESLDLKDEVRSLDLIMKNHQDKLTPYEASLFSKNVSLLLYGAKSDEFMDYLENTRKLCPSFSRYLIKYTYDLLLAEKFDQVLECLKNSSEIIQDLDEDDRAVLKINEATAYKKINNGQLSNSIYEELKKIVSKSLSQEITISCKSLMDDQQTLSNIKTLINIDHHFYYYFQQWPVISDNLKQQLRNNYEKHMIVTLDRAS